MEDTLTRKLFFKEAFGFFKKEFDSGANSNLKTNLPFVLPPGAENEDSFLNTCEQCYECVSVCPHESIRVWRNEDHTEFYGFPVIEPRKQPCYECEDYPCIEACPSGGLSFMYKKMGTAEISNSLCFAYLSHFCQTCYDNCPYPTKAITFDEQHRPQIIEKGCTGCGICTNTCPAEDPAITINLNKR